MNEVNPADLNFISKLTEIIGLNLGKDNFGVKELASAAGMNYFHLNRRLHSILNKNTSQFIRETRLQFAKEMLEQEEITAAEVAYKTGFGSPAYFNRCFHEYFGYPPGETKKRGFSQKEEYINKPFLNGQTEETIPTNFQEQPARKKLSRKGIFIVAAGILILCVLSWFFLNLLLKNSELRLKPEDKSIAVLPFKNLSNDEVNQYFADGIMEDILNLLYRVGEFRVISRTSVEQFRGSTKTAPEIAKVLKVNFILEGSVQRYNNIVRINVQLIDARNDRQILSEKYDRQFADIFSIQSGIAKQVANQLQAALSPNEIKEIEKIPTKNAEAYNLYLKGRFFWNKRTEEGVKKSIEYFEKAVEADPDYAQAWAGLADGYQILTGYDWYKPKDEGYTIAKKYLMKALELDTNLAEAHTTLGFILGYREWKWEEAIKEVTLAIKLNPNYSFAHQIYAQLLDITGDFKKAREEIDIALKLDPISPIIHHISATLYYNEGNFEAVLGESHEALSIEKNYNSAHWGCFYTYYRLGEAEKALDEFKTILQIDSLTSYTDMAEKIFAKYGTKGLIDLANKIYPKDAVLFAIAGKKEEALACIEGYLENRPGDGLVRLINKLNYESLRSEPRFKAVVDKLGLTEYYLKRVNDPGYIKK